MGSYFPPSLLLSFPNSLCRKTSPIKLQNTFDHKTEPRRQKKAMDLEPVLIESCLPLLCPELVIEMQSSSQVKHHQEPLRYQGDALHIAWAVIRKSGVGLNPTSIISLKWVIMKLLPSLVDSLITIIKSPMHKSWDVILSIFWRWCWEESMQLNFTNPPSLNIATRGGTVNGRREPQN